ncbi:MAG: VacB/RNase II family 3'-5' exoribonuclease [Leptospiraceae bacterium]|nr:VacB/RNase II family 3'-5' exoribonuclease [Leptospiraceae bacterium]MCP5510649.1 VacB/RNase II family 3'-5' exoribonuclease [Leptospiraceae bacterium]
MKKNIAPKLFEYLVLKSGETLSLPNLYELFNEEGKNSKQKKKKHKKEKHPHSKIVDEIAEFLGFLEIEGLVSISKKNITISRGLKLTGKISLSKRGDGFIKLKSGSEVFVPAEFTLGAISGDTVELIPLKIGKKGRLEGEVKNITSRGRNFYRMRISDEDVNYFYGKLLDMQGEIKEGALKKKSLLHDVSKALKNNEIVIVKLKENSYYDNNIYEVSFVSFEMGTTKDKDLNRILMKYNYHQNYPDHVLLNFPDDVVEEKVADWAHRVDLRDLWTVTIDGAGSKDFDDAISIEEEGDGIVRFYVHIADVSYYVKPSSPLDEEAYKRATSVYLIDSVIPMLPPVLSEDLCSLVAGKNRLAFTVEMTGDYSGRIFSAKYYKSIIKVDHRMTYDSAQAEIDTADPNNRFVKLMKLADGLKSYRIAKGRVELNLKEVYIATEENGDVKEIQWRERKSSHILIEELMLSANVKVAEYLRKKDAPALFRIHEEMDEEKLEVLNSFLALYGFKHHIESTEYDELQLVLAKIKGHEAEKIFNYFLLRSFMQAYYSGEKLGHWGLGFKDYCHFTSPIRRYPDLVVHRVLDALIFGEKELPYSKDEIKLMGFHTSDEERRAADAERDIQKIKACRYIQKTGVTEFVGIITGIKPQMVFFELEGYFGEGTVLHTYFTNEYELEIINEFSFYSKKYTTRFFLGQKMDLVLQEIDLEEMKIYLYPKSENKKKTS